MLMINIHETIKIKNKLNRTNYEKQRD